MVWQYVRSLGQGGMGRVDLVRNELGHGAKKIPLEETDESLQCFRAELAHLKRLERVPHVVQLDKVQVQI